METTAHPFDTFRHRRLMGRLTAVAVACLLVLAVDNPVLAFGLQERIELAPFDGSAGPGQPDEYPRAFGAAAAVDGDVAVVGAPQCVASGPCGRAYVYVRGAREWQQAAVLASDEVGRDTGFGAAVAISGDTIVVGARSARHPVWGTTSGRVFVFQRPAGGWSGHPEPAATLAFEPVGNGERSTFGADVAVDGDLVAVGDPSGLRDDGDPYHQRNGRVYTYRRPARGWSGETRALATLEPDDGRNAFGRSVALDGTTLVVGATGSGEEIGGAYVFADVQRLRGTRNEDSHLLGNGAGFGIDVDVSGDTVVVGASATDVQGDPARGTAYVYQRPTAGWASTHTAVTALVASDGRADDLFGRGVAIDGDEILVGAPERAVEGPGQAYRFRLPSGSWPYAMTEDVRLEPPDGAYGFGHAVTLDGALSVIGAPAFGQGAGSAHLYQPRPSGEHFEEQQAVDDDGSSSDGPYSYGPEQQAPSQENSG